MNGQAPVSCEVLVEVSRGPRGRVIVRRDVWPDGRASIHLAVQRRQAAGKWCSRSFVTLYVHDLPDVIAALAGISVPEAKPLAEVSTLVDARRQRAASLLRDEEIPAQDVERGVWGDDHEDAS